MCTHSRCVSAFRSWRSNHMLLITCVTVALSLSRVWLFATPWTVACQAPLSMGFSRQEYWEWVAHFLLQGFFPTQESNLHLLPCWWFFTAEPPGEPKYLNACLCVHTQVHMCQCVCLCARVYIYVWEFVSKTVHVPACLCYVCTCELVSSLLQTLICLCLWVPKWIFYCYGHQVQENILTCRDTSRWVFVHALQAVIINPCLCLCVFSWILLTTMHLIHWCVFIGVCVRACAPVKERRRSKGLQWIFIFVDITIWTEYFPRLIISGKKQWPCKCRGESYQPINFSLPFHGDCLLIFFIAQGTRLSALWCQRGVFVCVWLIRFVVQERLTWLTATKLHIKESVLKCRGLWSN